jgi:hypothetical protein
MSWIKAKQGALLLLFENAEDVPDGSVRYLLARCKETKSLVTC